VYRRGCDSAALLLRQRSDSNTITDNDLSHSGDGLFLSGHRPDLQPSVGNLIARNDASHSWHNGFEATFSWNNTFLDNIADSSDYGFWLGYSSGSTVLGNTVIGSRTAGIAIEHGSDNLLSGNVLIGGPAGIRIFAPRADGPDSRGYRVDDNVFAKLGRAVVLERTSQVRLRGNLFDGVADGIVADSETNGVQLAGNVFLRASGFFVRAPELDAGGNFWGTASAAEAMNRVWGKVNVEPWRPAREAWY
jgi:parallel beta-helix repeat protein